MANEKKSGGLLDEATELFSGFTGIVNGDVFDPAYWKGAESAPVKESKSNDDGEVIEEERTVRRSKRGTFLAAPKGDDKPKPDDKPAPDDKPKPE